MAIVTVSALASSLKKQSSLVTDFASIPNYLKDATEITGVAEALVMAECENDVIETVIFARKNNLCVVPRGAGTGLSGGCVPHKGSIILSTEKITHLKIDPIRKVAICGPGVITKTLQDEAFKFGLYYPPDPASYAESTIGGNVAEGAGGLRCKRFGVTKDYVLGIKGITAEGEIIQVGCYTGDSGFSLTDIFNASEGTLVVITEITLRLINSVPKGDTFLVAFDTTKDAAKTVSDIVNAGIVPNVLEFLDGDAADCSNKYEKTEGLDKVAAILLIESAKEGGQSQVNQIRSFCDSNNSTFFRHESDPVKADNLWKVRRNLSKAVKQISKIRISEDVAVPISKFPELVEYVSYMNSTSDIRMNSFGHAGDGNLHVNFITDDDSPKGREKIEREIERLLKKTVELGGTLTGEHGIGLAKKKYLELEFDRSTIQYMRKFKEIFDLHRILNSDKIFANSRKC
jgi:glycolate oxidase